MVYQIFEMDADLGPPAPLSPELWEKEGYPVDSPEDIENNIRRPYNLSLRNILATDGKLGWNGLVLSLIHI